MSVTHGMDIEEVRALGQDLQTRARTLDDILGTLERIVLNATWVGPDALRYKDQWWPEHRTRLQRVSEDLRGFGQSALNNAAEQEAVSGTGRHHPNSLASSGSSSAPHVVARETYRIESEAALFIGGGTENTVTVEEMSDGTYRVTITSDVSGQVSVSLADLAEKSPFVSAFINDTTVNAGVGVDFDSGLAVEFTAQDKESADALRAFLEGRSSSITNRLPGQSVDRGELVGALDIEGVSVSGITTQRTVESGAEAQLVSVGYETGGGVRRETTSLSSGETVDAYTFGTSEGGTHWNADSIERSTTVEVTRDATGSITGVRVIEETVAAADTRGGGEKTADFLLGVVTLGGVQDSELRVDVSVDEYVVPLDLVDGQLLEGQGDLGGILSEFGELRDQIDPIHSQYSGTSTGSTRGVADFGSTTEYGTQELVHRD